MLGSLPSIRGREFRIDLARRPIPARSRSQHAKPGNQPEAQLAGWVQKVRSDATLLTVLGDHVGAVERAGIPLRDVINEGNHRVWKQP